MSFVFNVPRLLEAGAWLDYRNTFSGGMGWRHPIDHYKRIIIHHSTTNPQGNAYAEAQYIHLLHTSPKYNGWGGIGYNFMVSSEEVEYQGKKYAKVAYVGDLSTARAHATNAKGIDKIPKSRGNDFLLGIVLVGDFTTRLPSEAQLRSAHELVKELVLYEDARLPHLTKMTDIRPHYSYDFTACPGLFDKYKLSIINGLDAEEDMQKQEEINRLTKRVSDLKTQLSAAEVALQRQIDDTNIVIAQNKELELSQRDLETTVKRQTEELAELQKLVDKLSDSSTMEQPKNKFTEFLLNLYNQFNK